jgi:hypothetical protein
MTENRDGALRIAQHLAKVLESLEQDATLTQEFLSGDGGLLVTRAGISYLGFDNAQPMRFEPDPMTDEAIREIRVASARQAANTFFDSLERNEDAFRLWEAGGHELVLRATGGEVRRVES